MMTGWTGEDVEGPALPATELLLSHRAERGPVDPLERARLARDEPESDPFDADERAANLVARGVMPGMLSDLTQRHMDTHAELTAELDKIEHGRRVTERVRGMLERGQVGALEAARMMDGDFGDAHRAEQLERRCANLRQQIREVSAMIAPQQAAAADPLEAAASRAHAAFVVATRERMAQAQAGTLRRVERPPFGSVSRGGGVAVRSEQCVHCTAAGVSDETSYLLHSDPEFNVPVTPPGSVPSHVPGDAELAEFGREAGVPFRPAAT